MAKNLSQSLGNVPLENPQREAFAQAIARGEPLLEAYRIVYGGHCRGRASRSLQVMNVREVRARVNHLRPGLALVADTADAASTTRAGAREAPTCQPVIYTTRAARRFCARLVEARQSLRSICREPGMPELRTLLWWLDTEPKFRAQYARARALQAELIADEILEIADNASEDFKEDATGKPRVDSEAIQRSKLRVDTRKWLVAKLLPKKYGDKAEGASASAASEKGKDEGIQYRLTEERRAALMERRRQQILASEKRDSAP